MNWSWHGAALWVGLVDRYDWIFFKLFASADASGPRSVHYRDLAALRPTLKELNEAAEWVRAQDASPTFATILEQVIGYAREDLIQSVVPDVSDVKEAGSASH
jgi:hypothetical protein